MFELPSAIFLIADGNEFRFARFYIVCEEVPLGDTRKSAHCLRLVGHTRECPNVTRHGTGCQLRHGRIREFCFKEFAAVCLFWNFLFSSIPVILLVTKRGLCLL